MSNFQICGFAIRTSFLLFDMIFSVLRWLCSMIIMQIKVSMTLYYILKFIKHGQYPAANEYYYRQ
jgi:hypothetical protein